MSELLLPNRKILSWWDMVSPREEEMPEFIKLVGPGWRTPTRRWEDLWRLRRGELNHVLGMRKFPTLRRLQRGSVSMFPSAVAAAGGAGGTEPDLTDIQNDHSSVAPSPSRSFIWYNSDGEIRWYEGTSTPTYAALTTQTDDANDHTNEWWPDQPETNEGLNWDIRYTNDTSGGSVTARYWLRTSVPADRTVDVWYLLDTVSNDAADAGVNGCLGVYRTNGIAKSPQTGVGTMIADIEIRATGTGSAVASHNTDQQVEGT